MIRKNKMIINHKTDLRVKGLINLQKFVKLINLSKKWKKINKIINKSKNKVI